MLQRPLINPENIESRWMNKNSGKKAPYVQDIPDLKSHQPFTDSYSKLSIISLSKREGSAEEQQSKLLQVTE
jgi:hypothetical protein